MIPLLSATHSDSCREFLYFKFLSASFFLTCIHAPSFYFFVPHAMLCICSYITVPVYLCIYTYFYVSMYKHIKNKNSNM